MQAIVRHTYGSPDVLKLVELPTPTPQAGEVLIQIAATSINAADWRMLRADPFLARIDGGLITPRSKILGFDVAGRVVAAGPGVTRFQVGDEVFGNLFELRGGAFAEYVAAPERLLVPKPANLSFEQAAAVPMAAVTALRGLRKGRPLQPGQSVLIQGASGGVGTFAIQIAKASGAEVTAVVGPRHLDLACQLGADHVLDYTRESFTARGAQYDLILGINGHHPLTAYQQALRPGGRYIMAGGPLSQILQIALHGPRLSKPGGLLMAALETKPTAADLAEVSPWLENGAVKPVIDRTYPLCQVPEAIRHMETGHPRGKIVVTLAG